MVVSYSAESYVKPGRKSSRREFLTGRATLDTLGDLAAGVGDAGPDARTGPAPSQVRSLLLQVERRAMACQFQVFLPARDDSVGMEAALAALDSVDLWEDRLSIFRDASEISRVNRGAGVQPVTVSPETCRLLTRCVQYHNSTGGAFDITAAPLFRAWGFHRRRGRMPSDSELAAAAQLVGSEHLHIDDESDTAFLDRDGMELNLGSVGKGFALDRCRDVFAGAGVENYLVHGGHSSLLARGNRWLDGDSPGWWVRLRHPLRDELVLAELRLCDRALATSGSGRQFFYHEGRRYGHVIDPRTATPADKVLSVTVSGPSAEQVDALATAFFVMGLDEAAAFCTAHPELSAVFVVAGSRSGSAGLERIGVADEDLRLPGTPQ